MADQPQPTLPGQGGAAGPGRAVKIVLAISLAINLAVAGLFLGNLLKNRTDGPRPQSVRDLGFGLFAPALTDEDRRELRRAFVERAPDMREARRAMREDLAEMLEAIRAAPFDPARLEAVLDRSSLRASERRDLGEALILDHLATLDQTERAAFADRLEQGLRRRFSGRRDDGEGRRP
jgi:uncharacterized membrane protein